MALKNILIAYDNTAGAEKALGLAADMAAGNDETHLDLVYVVPIPLLDSAQQANFKDILDMMIAEGEQILNDAIDKLDDDVADRTDAMILKGVNPATEIIKMADQGDYDLLIIGSRGLSGMKEYLGSVSHKVLHSVDCPVLIAK